MVCGFIMGCRNHDGVGAGQDARKFAGGQYHIGTFIGTAVTRDRDDSCPERAQDAADFATDGAEPDHHDGARRRDGQERRKAALPSVPRLVGKHGRDAALQGEQKRNRMRCDGRPIGLAGIAHRDPRRCAMPLDIVIAGGEQLNPFERGAEVFSASAILAEMKWSGQIRHRAVGSSLTAASALSTQ